jgi:hypothetical protein
MKTKSLLLGCSTFLLVLVVASLGVASYLFIDFGPRWTAPTDFAEQHAALVRSAASTPDRPLKGDGNWPLFVRIRDNTIAAHERVLGGQSDRMGAGIVWPDLFMPDSREPDPTKAQAIIDALEADGVFKDLDLFASDPRAVRRLDDANPQLGDPNDFSTIRQLARMSVYRFRADAAAGRHADARVHIRRALGLAQFLSVQASTLAAMNADSIAGLMMGTMRDAVIAHTIPEPDIAALQAIAESYIPSDLAHSLQGNRLIGLSILYRTLPETRVLSRSRAAQMHKLDHLYNQLIAAIPLPASERRAIEKAIAESSDATALIETDALLQIGTSVFEMNDMFHLERAANITLLAIERYRALNGRPPATLADLGALLPTIPPDPFSKSGLVYRPDPASPRGYVLYSTGLDGIDDGRKQNPRYNYGALSPEGGGTDYLLFPPFQRPPKQAP